MGRVITWFPSGLDGKPERTSGPKMYGLILQNMAEYIQNKHGDNMWKKVSYRQMTI